MLRILGFQPLEYSRMLLNPMFIRDLLCSQIVFDELRLLFVPRNTQYNLRSNNSLVVPYHRVNYGIYEPITRFIILYNNLKDVVNFYNYSKISFKQEYFLQISILRNY